MIVSKLEVRIEWNGDFLVENVMNLLLSGNVVPA